MGADVGGWNGYRSSPLPLAHPGPSLSFAHPIMFVLFAVLLALACLLLGWLRAKKRHESSRV